MEKVINESRKIDADAKEATIRDYLLNKILSLYNKGMIVIANNVVKDTSNFSKRDLIKELRRLEKDGLITWDDSQLSPDTHVRPTVIR
jgi:hypothetical protein